MADKEKVRNDFDWSVDNKTYWYKNEKFLDEIYCVLNQGYGDINYCIENTFFTLR